MVSSNIKARKELNFDDLMPLMLAVTRCRTLVHYGHKHLCTKHLCKVDKHHIDKCDLLQLESGIKVTAFNDDLMNMKLFSIPKDRLLQLHQHYTALKDRIAALEKPPDDGEAKFIPINDSGKIKSSAQTR